MIQNGVVVPPGEADASGQRIGPICQAGWMRRAVVRRRTIKPFRALALVILFNLTFSAAYIVFFARTFHFDKRLVMLHLTIVAGLMALVLALGLSVFSKRVRESRAIRLLLTAIPATGFVLLVLIYLADFVSNRFWGNNVNLDLVEQFLFRPGQATQLPISNSVYVSIACGLTLVYVFYLSVSGPVFRSLEELFLPGRRFSLFRDRQRVRRSSAVLALFILCYAVLFAGSWFLTRRHAQLAREPIVGFFVQTENVSDFGHYEVKKRLREEEPLVRSQYPRVSSFDRRNVVVMIVDSLRADHMQVYGYERPDTPFLTSLLESGRLKKVDLALSTCSETNCGILSTMASKNLRGLVREDFKVYDLLHDQGYNVYFVLSGDHAWYGLKELYGDTPDLIFDGTDSKRYGINDDRIIFEGLDKIPQYAGIPAFFYFHLMSAHAGGIREDRYRLYNPSCDGLDWFALLEGKYDKASLTNTYDNGILQADAKIEQLFAALREKGYLDNSLAIILADHGEGLGEHGEYAHIFSLHQEFMRIPLLIYDSPEAKYGNLEFATQVDVAPTVVDRLGLPIPRTWQGQSLVNPNIKEYSFHETGQHGAIRAVIYRTGSAMYKYIQSEKHEELYEVVSDPYEQFDLMDTGDRQLVKRLREKLGEFLLLSY